MKEDDTGTSADFRNTSVESQKSVASCGFNVVARPGSRKKSASPKISVNPKEAQWIKGALSLSVDSESKRRDKRFQEGPVPGDFGDHKPIPEEAMTLVPLGQEEREIGFQIQEKIAASLGCDFFCEGDDDFFVELRDTTVRFTKEEVEDVDYFRKRLFEALGIEEGERE